MTEDYWGCNWYPNDPKILDQTWDSWVRIHPYKFSNPDIIMVVCNHTRFLHVKMCL